MSDPDELRRLVHLVVYAWCGVAAAVFVVLFFIDAPYGRYARDRWGPRVSAGLAWGVMEGVSLVVMAGCGIAALTAGRVVPAHASLLGALWILHYLNRSVVYPLRLGKNARAMPLAVVGMAAFFNVVNAGTNGLSLFYLEAEIAGGAWARVAAGVALFVLGAALNLWSDERLLALRRENEGYVLPRGGAFELVSCPNYLGEILEWTGFALAAWSLPALAFAAWTFANLAPRARAHHRFYREKFPDTPKKRRALLPFVW